MPETEDSQQASDPLLNEERQRHAGEVFDDIRSIFNETKAGFSQLLGIHESALRNLEDKDRECANRFLQGTMVKTLDALKQHKENLPPDKQPELDQLIEEFRNAAVSGFQWRTQRLLARTENDVGSDEVSRHSGIAKDLIHNFFDADKPIKLHELIRCMEPFIKEEESEKRTPIQLWKDPRIQEICNAYVEDQCKHKDRKKPIALLYAAAEFALRKQVTQPVMKEELGINLASITKITKNYLPDVQSIEPALEILQKYIGKKGAGEIRSKWKELYEELDSKRSGRVIERLKDEQNLRMRAKDIVESCGVTITKRGPGAIISQALSNQTTVICPTQLWHIYAPSGCKLHTGINLSIEEEVEIRESYTKGASKLVVPMQKVWGVTNDDLEAAGVDIDELKKLNAGTEETALTEREVADIIFRLGVEKQALPTLQNWVAGEEPASLSKMVTVLRKKVGMLRTLAKDASIARHTIDRLEEGGEVQPLIAIKDLCRAAGVRGIPSTVAIETQFLFNEKQKSEHHPLRAACEAIVGRTHRNWQSFYESHEKEMTAFTNYGDFNNNMLKATGKGSVKYSHLQSFLAAAGIKKDSSCWLYLKLLTKYGNVEEALKEWVVQTGKDKKWYVIRCLNNLIACSNPDNQKENQEGEQSDPMQEYRRLLRRKLKLYRWKAGLPALRQSQQICTPVEDRAALILEELPGVTKEHLQAVQDVIPPLPAPKNNNISLSDEEDCKTRFRKTREYAKQQIGQDDMSQYIRNIRCPLLLPKEEHALIVQVQKAGELYESELSDIVEAAHHIHRKDPKFLQIMKDLGVDIMHATHGKHTGGEDEQTLSKEHASPEQVKESLKLLFERIARSQIQDLDTMQWQETSDAPEQTIICNITEAQRHLTLLRNKRVSALHTPEISSLIELVEKTARVTVSALEEDDPLARHVQSMLQELRGGLLSNTDCGEYVREAIKLNGFDGEISFDTARKIFIEANMRLVISEAKKWQEQGNLALLEIINEGNSGLIQATHDFDPTLGTRFSTHGSTKINNTIRYALQNRSEAIRRPVSAKESIRKYHITARQLEDTLGHPPKRQEVFDKMDLSLDQRVNLAKLLDAPTTVSLSQVSDDGAEQEMQVEEDIAPPEENAVRNEEWEQLRSKVNELDEPDRTILILHYGLEEEQLTLSEIARRLDLSKERIRQLKNRGLETLRGGPSQRTDGENYDDNDEDGEE